ncbi:DUF2786 domain-containing protein [Streptomyces sp. NPDC057307]|uniref:DUF2786 domain-containing protein n=1 Tax=Streptomyces sp. NPDC057307 TaxID=3346096 RepID=UPI003628999A
MTEENADEMSAAGFAAARSGWLRTRVTELSETLSDHSPRLYALIPQDLGDRRLVTALVTVRIAADEARVQPMTETVAWLELLIPQGHRHDLHSAVREVWSALVPAGDPALWSWNAEAWEELLLALWRNHRARTVERHQADDELVCRWGVRAGELADVPLAERAPANFGQSLVPLSRFLTSEGEPARLLVQAVLSQPDAVDWLDDSLIVYEEALQGAGYLAFLARQRLSATYLSEWCEKQAGEATHVGEAFLRELSDAVEAYLVQVLQPVISALSLPERVVLGTGEVSARRDTNEYLTEFLDCVRAASGDVHAEGEAGGEFDGRSVEEATERLEQGEVTWHGMRGSVPVWYHVVTSPQERAAALALSGGTSSAIRVRTDVHEPGPSNRLHKLFGPGGPDAETTTDDWYPDPGIEVHYSRHSATDLCELMALAGLGHARLELLMRDADGGVRPLRSLRIRVRPADASAWAAGALIQLRTLVPYLDELADVIAREGESEEWAPGEQGELEPEESDGLHDDQDDQDGSDSSSESTGASGRQQEPADTTRSNGPENPEVPSPRSPSTPAAGALPAALLARVKRILRHAEDPAATKDESEAFLKKATELMAKYGIEQAMLQGDEPTSEQPVDRVVEVTAPWMRECKRLLAWIANAMRCQSIYPGGKANRHRVHLFGFASDLQAVDVLYASLRLQMLQGAEVASTNHRPVGEDSRAYKRSWMLGFVRAVTLRIAEAGQAAQAETENDREQSERDRHAASPETPATSEGRSVALVLADRTAAVQAEVTSRYPKLGKARRSRLTGSGYRQGHVDGQRANIGGLSLEDQEEEEFEFIA